jgi:flagellar basal-body rod modification protein FlgD
MNVSSIGNDTPQTAAPDGAAHSTGRDEFLKLLVAQLEHQDPLQPVEGTEFATQLAQFSSVEQLVQINDRLGLLEVGQAAAANSEATALIGHDVTARSDELHLAEPASPTLHFELESAAQEVTLAVTDDSGRVVRTLSKGPLGAGAQQVAWSGAPLSAGTYHVSIEAHAANGAAVVAHGRTHGLVTGVSLENGYPELLIDDLRVRLGDVIAVGGKDPAGA